MSIYWINILTRYTYRKKCVIVYAISIDWGAYIIRIHSRFIMDTCLNVSYVVINLVVSGPVSWCYSGPIVLIIPKPCFAPWSKFKYFRNLADFNRLLLSDMIIIFHENNYPKRVYSLFCCNMRNIFKPFYKDACHKWSLCIH